MTLYEKKVCSKIDMEQVVTVTSTQVVELIAIPTITKGMELVVVFHSDIELEEMITSTKAVDPTNIQGCWSWWRFAGWRISSW